MIAMKIGPIFSNFRLYPMRLSPPPPSPPPKTYGIKPTQRKTNEHET